MEPKQRERRTRIYKQDLFPPFASLGEKREIDMSEYRHVLHVNFGLKKNPMNGNLSFLQNQRLILEGIFKISKCKVKQRGVHYLSRDAFIELQRDVSMNFSDFYKAQMNSSEQEQYEGWEKGMQLLCKVDLGSFKENVIQSILPEHEYTLFKEFFCQFSFPEPTGKLGARIDEINENDYYSNSDLPMQKEQVTEQVIEKEKGDALGQSNHEMHLLYNDLNKKCNLNDERPFDLIETNDLHNSNQEWIQAERKRDDYLDGIEDLEWPDEEGPVDFYKTFCSKQKVEGGKHDDNDNDDLLSSEDIRAMGTYVP
eukprot:1724766-Rhodomonas_salina.1